MTTEKNINSEVLLTSATVPICKMNKCAKSVLVISHLICTVWLVRLFVVVLWKCATPHTISMVWSLWGPIPAPSYTAIVNIFLDRWEVHLTPLTVILHGDFYGNTNQSITAKAPTPVKTPPTWYGLPVGEGSWDEGGQSLKPLDRFRVKLLLTANLGSAVFIYFPTGQELIDFTDPSALLWGNFNHTRAELEFRNVKQQCTNYQVEDLITDAKTVSFFLQSVIWYSQYTCFNHAPVTLY